MKRLLYILLSIGIVFSYQCKETKKDNSLLFVGLAAAGSGGAASGGAASGGGGTQETVATPTFSPASGSHSNTAMNLAISTTTSGASIYFTTDGTTPTTASTLYSSAVHIWFLAGKTVKAIATKSGLSSSAVATLTGMFSYPPLKTGQTTVYAAGDNGTNQSGVARGYSDNGDGTVTDIATGLVWQKCSKGQTGADCSGGAATTETWANAGTYCSTLTLAGRTWRLPSRQELETLPDYSKSNPAIDTTFFPSTVASAYWSSTTYAPNTTSAWNVNFVNFGIFGNGDVAGSVKTNNYYVRCVSGPSKGSSNSFTDNNDGTVKDNATGLVWQKCSRGQNNDSTCSGSATTANWTTALTYCSGLTLEGRTWRLPTVNELKSLVDTTKASGPTIDTTAFPSTVASYYWSSTTYAPNTTFAWFVVFDDGNVNVHNKATSFYVRCVSGP
jgi:hypothetical protein